MFYYPQGAVDVRTPECSSGSIPYALRDHCADVNLVTQSFAERKGWRIIPTNTALSTGMVIGLIDPQDAFVHILPGTQHEVRLRIEETLVVGDTDLFGLLVGNRQMKPVADSLSQYPTAHLTLSPKTLEEPHYSIRHPHDQRAPRPPWRGKTQSDVRKHLCQAGGCRYPFNTGGGRATEPAKPSRKRRQLQLWKQGQREAPTGDRVRSSAADKEASTGGTQGATKGQAQARPNAVPVENAPVMSFEEAEKAGARMEGAAALEDVVGDIGPPIMWELTRDMMIASISFGHSGMEVRPG